MGIYGAVVIYPVKSPVTTAPAARKKLADAIVVAMEECGFLPAGTLANLPDERDRLGTFATGELFEDKEGRPKKVACHHYAIDAERLTPAVGELVYCDTAKNLWGEKDRKKRDLIALPFVDVSVFSKPHELHDHNAKVVCKTNVVLEFSYQDVRLSKEIHRVRDEKHPLLKRLSSICESKIRWGVVSG